MNRTYFLGAFILKNGLKSAVKILIKRVCRGWWKVVFRRAYGQTWTMIFLMNGRMIEVKSYKQTKENICSNFERNTMPDSWSYMSKSLAEEKLRRKVIKSEIENVTCL